MKSNLLYIIGGIVLFAGIIFFLIGFGVVGFDINKLSTSPDYKEKTFVSTDPVTLINAEDENVGIDIISSNDENVHITYYENKKTKYIINEENGVLDLSIKKTYLWTDNFFNFNFQNNNLVIAVPKDYTGDLQIKTSNAQISVSNILAGGVDLKTSNSRINIEYLNASGNVRLDTSNGRISLENLISQGDLIADTSNSSVEITSTEAKNIDVETKNGKITVNSASSLESINLETSNSAINFDNTIFTNELRCKTSNGSIEGLLEGSMVDYSIISDTSNGDNSLPDNMSGGDKKLNVKTSNAHIDIEFSN